MTINYNKLPEIQKGIIKEFLKPLNPNVSTACLLNVLNSKLTQMMTFKLVKFKEMECQNPHILNYYALNFISSGGGKDKMVNEIDDYLLPDFKLYFQDKNRDYVSKRLREITQEASEFYDTDKQQKSYIETEKKTIRNLRFELEEATAEGLNKDCETLNLAGYGCIFVKISELGLFLENATNDQRLFINSLVKIYDGKAGTKSIKGENQSSDVQGIPCNLLAYSDTNKLLKSKAGEYLNKLLDTGLARRSFITYMPDKLLVIEEDYKQTMKIKNEAYTRARELREKLFKKFQSLKHNSEFVLTNEAYEIYHNYRVQNEKSFNHQLNKTDDVLLKEVKNRFWKCLKLSCLIACLQHPEDTNIYPDDVKMAIYQTELFAEDFEQFYKAKPESDTDKLFKYLLSNIGRWVTKQDIRKQRIVNNNYFSKWFNEQLDYIDELAEVHGYILKRESFNNNTGLRIKLVESNLNKELNPNIKNVTDLIAS